MAKITAAQILQKLYLKHTQKADPRQLPDAFYTEVKTGRSRPGYLRFDAVAIKQSWARPCITGYEIKVSRSDFLRDKKWQNYQKYCHEFYFVSPPGIVKVEDLDAAGCGDVGLIYYSAEHDTLFTKRRALYRKINLRSPEVVGMLMYLAMYRAYVNNSTTLKAGENA
jgi:hypothetical protein